MAVLSTECNVYDLDVYLDVYVYLEVLESCRNINNHIFFVNHNNIGILYYGILLYGLKATSRIANWFSMSLQLIKRHYDISYCVILRCESTRQIMCTRIFIV